VPVRLMTVQEVWEAEYKARRYLEHCSEEELARRSNDLLGNTTILTDDGKIGCLSPASEEGRPWWKANTHVLHEWFLRGYTLERLGQLSKTAQVPRSTWPDAPRALKAIAGRRTSSTPILVKYGEAKYLRDMLDHGIIRVSGASFYADPSLNPAIKDDELRISLSALGSEVKLKIPEHRGGPPTKEVPALGNVTFSYASKTNYYVYCLSTTLDCRLFPDFKADACVIISNPTEFIKRVYACFDRAVPGWSGITWPVVYLDPFLSRLPLKTPDGRVDVHLCKHFRFAYQKEFRFVWLPDEMKTDLQPVFLKPGSLKEFCELIEI
jgi:hypothetical protein